ncbi:MAG: gamma-glutamylcyclotransferase [Pontiellaceae bacterium]|nr:gamma-glutamylcyclotransferase [Pontiellaceae bacterium]
MKSDHSISANVQSEERELLFVYGTLRRDAPNSMNHLLGDQADFVSEGTYQGKLYQIADYPGVVPSPNPDDQVQGELYSIRDPEQLLTKLDEYEECGAAFQEPTEYIRRRASITLPDATPCTVWIYLYNRPIENLR